MWCRCRPHVLPADSDALAIAAEANVAVNLIAVEMVDRVVETLLGVSVRLGGKRIVDAIPPTLFLKCFENCLLVGGRAPKTLDEDVRTPQFPEFLVPPW